MAHKFTLNSESLKRKFAVYVVIAKGKTNIKIYVGKTGDNRDGCNPVISRCGNHFSYNKIHSQIRNMIPDHEDREYTYVFEHFDNYYKDKIKRRVAVDKINKMEIWLNERVHLAINGHSNCELLNPYQSKAKRQEFRSKENEKKIMTIVDFMLREIK